MTAAGQRDSATHNASREIKGARSIYWRASGRSMDLSLFHTPRWKWSRGRILFSRADSASPRRARNAIRTCPVVPESLCRFARPRAVRAVDVSAARCDRRHRPAVVLWRTGTARPPFRMRPVWRCNDPIAHSARFKSRRPDFFSVEALRPTGRRAFSFQRQELRLDECVQLSSAL